MRSAWFLLFGCLTLHKSVAASQHTTAADGPGGEATPLEEMLQRAETILIRSMLMRLAEERDSNDADSPPTEGIFKRQHPGKRLEEEFEKRQHPGKREEGEGKEGGYLEAEKRQHPGRRSAFDQYSGENADRQLAFLSELPKRQHPDKRTPFYNKRQHPGRRSWEGESDSSERGPLEKLGRRYLETASSSRVLSSPCELQDPAACSKPSYVLELLGNMNKNWAEVKRQHPGRRLASDDQLEGRV
ncbi:pro-thyrotropin-releasing hormone [Carcharodon carcharias]|uniref:pro-thyrotropin-releasing hormone n=1 Tax=Carcharodon carcharias TaxID=13397 RepID=UPI001B7E8656|nr:pro-thyrotropin-releasing hormone [Carcharodon carcharias]